MSIVTLRLPNVNPRTEIRPNVCPYCSGETFQRWGRVLKPVELLYQISIDCKERD
jgi:hypothetical protein